MGLLKSCHSRCYSFYLLECRRCKVIKLSRLRNESSELIVQTSNPNDRKRLLESLNRQHSDTQVTNKRPPFRQSIGPFDDKTPLILSSSLVDQQSRNRNEDLVVPSTVCAISNLPREDLRKRDQLKSASSNRINPGVQIPSLTQESIRLAKALGFVRKTKKAGVACGGGANKNDTQKVCSKIRNELPVYKTQSKKSQKGIIYSPDVSVNEFNQLRACNFYEKEKNRRRRKSKTRLSKEQDLLHDRSHTIRLKLMKQNKLRPKIGEIVPWKSERYCPVAIAERRKRLRRPPTIKRSNYAGKTRSAYCI